MKHILGPAAAAGVALLASALLAGCGNGSSASGGGTFPDAGCLTSGAPVALAIGARSNSPAPNLSPSDNDLLTSAINADQQITVVRVDGAPQSVFDQAYTPSGANPALQKQGYNKYVDTLKGILAGTAESATDVRAQAAQVNDLQALDVAASDLQHVGGGDLLLLDSGLQTMAPLDFRTGLLADDPQTIATYLKGANELPPLQGIHVEFSGLGWTAAPQGSLGMANQRKIVQIWTAIANAAGASCVAIDPAAPNSSSALSGRPPVSVVSLPKPPPPPKPCSTMNLDDTNNVGFDFDSTEFRDPSGARATLQKLANVMTSSNESVTLTGATSSEGTDAYNQRLSLERAQAVQGVLIQLGVPASRITTVGDGSHLPGRLNDRGPNGQLLIGPAIQNRKVVAKLIGSSCSSS